MAIRPFDQQRMLILKMIEKVISPLKKKPITARIIDCILLGVFILSPLGMIIFDKAHHSLTQEQLRLMHESIFISFTESFRPEFWIFSGSITIVTILVGIGLKLKDFKKQKQTEEYLLTRQRITTQILNSVNHPIFQIDLNLNFVALNTFYLKLFGLMDVNQIIGRNYREFYNEANITEFVTQVKKVMITGQPIEYILDAAIAGIGKVKRILNPVKDSAGVIKGVVIEATEMEKPESKDIVSICSYCKSVKIDDVYVPVETILPNGLGYKPSFSHGICPACYEKAKEDVEEGMF
jgi:PAS domain-containing protein